MLHSGLLRSLWMAAFAAHSSAQVAAPPVGVAAKILWTVQVGKTPVTFALPASRQEIYVVNRGDATVSVVRTREPRAVTHVVRVRKTPLVIASSPDGREVYVGSDRGIDIISTATKTVEAVNPDVGKYDTRDLVVTRDGSVVYLAASHAGLLRLDVKTRRVSKVHSAALAYGVALTHDDKLLYVNYQGGGPGGRWGHDSIGRFDARTGAYLGSITGLPNVGDHLAVSPGGTQLWALGLDACISREYDHIGCPIVPGGIINVINTLDNKLLRSVGLPAIAGPTNVAFSPDRSVAAASGAGLWLFSSRTLELIGIIKWVDGDVKFVSDRTRAYATLQEKGQLAALEFRYR